VRLKGFEEFADHLKKMTAVYRRNRKLRPVAFLIERASADFTTALEATLSGFEAVCIDAMRDVMEIEFLLRDFFFQPDNISKWLNADEKERNRQFRPAVLRQRYAAQIGEAPQDVSEAADYKAHSMSLHVSPAETGLVYRGISQIDDYVRNDAPFWEIFEHARRLLFAIHRLRRKLARHLKSPLGPERGLKHFWVAWGRTQEWSHFYFAILDAASDRQKTDAIEARA
jgi:hypothetical protein